MQTDIIVNVNNPHEENIVVPDTGYLNHHTGTGNSNSQFFLLGILGITVLIATVIFLVFKKALFHESPKYGTENVNLVSILVPKIGTLVEYNKRELK